MSIPHAQFAHQWANNTDESERKSSSDLFYEGDKIYSFGHHWCIANKEHIESKGVVLFNSESYGSYTSKQTGHVYNATTHFNKIYVVKPDARNKAEHKKNYHTILKQIGELVATEKKGRVGTYASDRRLRQIRSKLKNANKYTKLFKLGFRQLSLEQESYMELAGKLSKIEKRKLAKEERARKKRYEEQRERDLKQRESANKYLNNKADSWFNDTLDRSDNSNFMSYSRLLNIPYCRISKDEKNIETSHGASFPIKFAKLIWKQISHCKSTGENWKANGHTIKAGDFRIERIDGDGTLKSGCHIVRYEQMLPVAIKLKLEV